MRANFSELWFQTRVAVYFLYAISCVITRTSPKLKGRSYKDIQPNDFSTMGDIYFLGWSCICGTIGEFVIQTRICSLFPMRQLWHFLIERLPYYRRCLSFVLKMDARYDSRVTSPIAKRGLFPLSHSCILNTYNLQPPLPNRLKKPVHRRDVATGE